MCLWRFLFAREVRYSVAQYDGSIRINTGIETKEFKAGSKEIETEARHMAKSVSDSLGDGAKIALQKQTDAFVKQNQLYARQEQKIKDLGSKLHELQRTKVETPIFKETTKELETAEKRLDKFFGDLRKIEITGGYTSSDKLKKETKEISSLQEKINSLSVEMKRLSKESPEYRSANNELKKYQQSLDLVETALKEQISTNEKIKNSAPYKKAVAQIDIYKQTVKELREQLKTLESSGEAYQPADTSKVTQELAAAEQKQMQMLSALQTSMDALVQKTSKEAIEEQRLAQIRENAVVGNQHIVEVVERRKQLMQEIADLEKAGVTQGYEDYDSKIGELGQLEQEIRDYGKGVESVKESYGKLGKIARKALQSAAGFLKGAKSYVVSLGKAIKNIGQKIFPSLSKSAKRTNNTVNSGLKNILKYVLGIMSLSKVLSATKEGFRNLALYSDQTNADISSLMSSLAQLKNSLATAFAPILTAVTPALTQLISLVSQAATYVAQLTSALTGKGTYTKAIETQKDYAESLKGTADAAKEAEGSLSAYDKINSLQKEKESEEESGIASLEFEEVEIENPIKNLADRIKEAWKNADFTDIGHSLGKKLKNMLENIPWDEIKQKAYDLGKSLATLLNGIFQTEGLGERIEITIGEALNTALNFAYGFIHNFDFGAFGKFVGDGINGAFLAFDWQLLALTLAEAINGIFLSLLEFSKTVKWSEIGAVIAGAISTFFKEWDPQVMADGISTFIIGILDFLISLIEETDWKLVGQKIGQLVTDIKWDDMAVRLGELLAKAINGAFEALIAFVETIDWWEVGKAIIDGIVTFIEELDFGTMGEAISSVAKGFLNLLTGALEGVNWVEVGKMLWEKLVDLVTGIDWGGIISKAIELIGSFHGMAWGLLVGILTGIIEDVAKWIDEKMQELGDCTIEGLLKGIMDAITGIATWIKEHIFDPFIKGFKAAFGIHSPSTVMAEQGKFIIEGLLEGIEGLIGKVVQKFIDLKDDVVEKVVEIKNNAMEKFNDLKTDAIDAFNNLKINVLDTWDNIVKGVGNAVKDIKDAVKGAIEAITSVKETEISYSGTRAKDYATITSRPNFRATSIPHLATGAVIPPNREFLAVLGDQKRGTNIETPLDTMIDAFKQALKEMNGGSEKIELTTMLDSDVLEKKMIEIDRKHRKRTGKPLLT